MIENLVEAAHRTQCKEAQYYKQALAEVRRNQDSDGLPELAVQLFGTTESKKVHAAVHAWSKHRKAEPHAVEEAAPKPGAYYPPPAYGYNQPPPSYEMPQGGYGRRGGYNARRGARLSQTRSLPGKC